MGTLVDKRAAVLLAFGKSLPDDLLLDTRSFCAWLGIGDALAQKWRSTGFGPQPIWLSKRRVRYEVKTVKTWLQTRLSKEAAM